MTRPARERSMTRTAKALVPLPLVLLLVLLAACGNGATTTSAATQGAGAVTTTTPAATAPAATAVSTPAASATATPAQTATASATTAGTATASPVGQAQVVADYFLENGKVWPVHRPIARTLEVAHEAMNQLLSGPTASEQAAGLSTSIPAGTILRDVTIANGVATVDLSESFTASSGGPLPARLAQVVYTLTQFPNVQAVTIEVGGKPVVQSLPGTPAPQLPQPARRADFEDLTPAILIESPVLAATVASPAHVTGSANVFEAQFVVQVVDQQGKVLKEQQVHATSGTGQRGTFDVQVPFSVSAPQPGKIVAFELSAKDGSRVNLVEVPVTLAP